MNVLNEKLLETLKCPSCFQYMMTPVYVCLSGHSICDSCWNTNSCPVCKLALTDTRNFALENISTFVYYPCANEDQGCSQVMKMEELDGHQQKCDYRSYTCRLSKRCLWQGTRDKLKKHFFERHENNVLIGKDTIRLWTRDKADGIVYVMVAFDELFYVHTKIRNDIVYWTVQYVGRPEDVILFCFELKIFTEEFNDRKMEFLELCHDDTKEDIDELIDSSFCVAVPISVLETYMNLQGMVLYKLEIKRA